MRLILGSGLGTAGNKTWVYVYKNKDAHLLYARSLEKIGDFISTQHEYETLHSYFSTPEATYHFALFLKSQDKTEEAKALLCEIIEQSIISGRQYYSLYKDLLNNTRNELYGQEKTRKDYTALYIFYSVKFLILNIPFNTGIIWYSKKAEYLFSQKGVERVSKILGTL